jgi:hypothetical protein
MLIRSTPHACYVILRNGLTLELCYDTNRVGREPRAAESGVEEKFRPALLASQGVWVFREEVLLEVKVGQA